MWLIPQCEPGLSMGWVNLRVGLDWVEMGRVFPPFGRLGRVGRLQNVKVLDNATLVLNYWCNLCGHSCCASCLQFFDTVGWAAGRASRL